MDSDLQSLFKRKDKKKGKKNVVSLDVFQAELEKSAKQMEEQYLENDGNAEETNQVTSYAESEPDFIPAGLTIKNFDEEVVKEVIEANQKEEKVPVTTKTWGSEPVVAAPIIQVVHKVASVYKPPSRQTQKHARLDLASDAAFPTIASAQEIEKIHEEEKEEHANSWNKVGETGPKEKSKTYNLDFGQLQKPANKNLADLYNGTNSYGAPYGSGNRREGGGDRYQQRGDFEHGSRDGGNRFEKPEPKTAACDSIENWRSEKKTAPAETVSTHSNDYVRRDEGGYGSRRDEGSFRGRRDDNFGGRRDDNFGGRRDDNFGGRREDNFGGRREDNFGGRREDNFGGRREEQDNTPDNWRASSKMGPAATVAVAKTTPQPIASTEPNQVKSNLYVPPNRR
uniref:HABP4_PAI-RBP1 domain-containing protein n=1 Tax=Rhabditophanes sp. KR3021 TaxID=114890 RepID=A0AC35TM82_9BILA